MNKRHIDYDYTATLFTNESKGELGDIYELISKITTQGSSAIDIPCSSGMKIATLASRYRHVYCYDNSNGMLGESDLICKKSNIRNVTLKKLDLKDLHKINIQVDDVYILSYAIQFLTLLELELLFLNFRKFSKRIILEIFDYSKNFKNEKISYIQTESRTIKLTKKYSLSNDIVNIVKTYEEEEFHSIQNIQMFNYSLSFFEDIIHKNGYKLIKTYSDYSGSDYIDGPRTVLVIENY